MITGLGVDITDIDRIKAAVAHNSHFIKRILTEAEIKQMVNFSEKRRIEYIAGRFSAKESYSKAFGSGLGSAVRFHDLTIVDDEKGKPIILTHPFDGRAFVSISHTNEIVMTEVILERIEDK